MTDQTTTTTDHVYSGPLSSLWCTECGKPRSAHESTERCESGWTGDRCQLPLNHDGDHDND